MQPYNEEEADERYPDEDVAKPTTAQWSWTPKNIAIAAGSIAGLGFVVWFVMEFNKAKAAAIAKVAANAAS